MRYFLLSLFITCLSSASMGQELAADSGLSLHIIADQVCASKKDLSVSFTYYYKNNTNKHLVISDYYETCMWESLLAREDTFSVEENSKTASNTPPGLLLVIRDEQGKVVLPVIPTDSSRLLAYERYKEDSTAFFDSYDLKKNRGFHNHTRVLRPRDELLSVIILKLNKRNCFHSGLFVFDPAKKYTLSLVYTAPEDFYAYINPSFLSKGDHIFTGQLHSAEIPFCIKK